MEQMGALVQVIFWGTMVAAAVVLPIGGWLKLEIGRGNL